MADNDAITHLPDLEAVAAALTAAGVAANLIDRFCHQAEAIRDGAGRFKRPPTLVIFSEQAGPTYRLTIYPEGYGLERLSEEEADRIWDETIRPTRGPRRST